MSKSSPKAKGPKRPIFNAAEQAVVDRLNRIHAVLDVSEFHPDAYSILTMLAVAAVRDGRWVQTYADGGIDP